MNITSNWEMVLSCTNWYLQTWLTGCRLTTTLPSLFSAILCELFGERLVIRTTAEINALVQGVFIHLWSIVGVEMRLVLSLLEWLDLIKRTIHTCLYKSDGKNVCGFETSLHINVIWTKLAAIHIEGICEVVLIECDWMLLNG